MRRRFRPTPSSLRESTAAPPRSWRMPEHSARLRWHRRLRPYGPRALGDALRGTRLRTARSERLADRTLAHALRRAGNSARSGSSGAPRQTLQDRRIRLVQPLQTSPRGREAPTRSVRGPAARIWQMDIAGAHRWTQGRGVRVALIDTGVDIEHKDLRGNIASAANFVDADAVSSSRPAWNRTRGNHRRRGQQPRRNRREAPAARLQSTRPAGNSKPTPIQPDAIPSPSPAPWPPHSMRRRRSSI